MNLQCIKTGAYVWLPSESSNVHGDLFELDGYYFLSCAGDWRTCSAYWNDHPQRTGENYHLVMEEYETCGPNMLIASKDNCGPFEYKGHNPPPYEDQDDENL